MSVKKIESLNKHENPATNTNPFNIQTYLNDNWDKIKDVIDNNADELTTAQQDIADIKSKNTEQDTNISNINAKNTEQDSIIETNETKITELQSDNETNKTNIANLQSDNATNKSNIQGLQTDNTINKQDISNIKTEQTTQNANITKNTSDITEIKSKNATQDEEIANINKKDTAQDTNIETLTQRLTEKDNQIAELKAENEDLKEDLSNSQIHGKASGEYVHLSDSAKMNCEIGIWGNSKQNVTEQGKNLLDSSFSSFSSNGITATYNKDTQEITINGECTYNNTGLRLSRFAGVELKANEKLYAKVKYISGSCTGGNDCRFGIFSADWSKNTGSKLNGISGDLSSSLTASADTTISIAQLRFDKGDICDNLKIKLMVSKEDVAYEPFVPDSPSIDYPSEIESVSSANVKVRNSNLGELEIGNFYDSDGSAMTSVKSYRSFIPIIGAGKYYIYYDFDYNKLGVNILGSGIAIYDKNNTRLSLKDITDNYIYISEEEIKKGAKWLKIKFYNAAVTSISLDYIKKFQVNYQESTDYIPHEEQNYPVDMQEPFKGINDIRDCFVLKEDGKWYERHKINRVSLNDLALTKGTAEPIKFYVKINAVAPSANSQNAQIISNSFKTLSYDTLNKGSNGIALRSDGYLFIYDSVYKDKEVDEFKSKLLENNAYVDYILAEPLDIECTEAQTQQLNALQKAKTYKNITNITTDTIAVLDVDYKRDLETYQRQQDDRITAIEQLLSTTATSAMLLDNVQSDLESEVK